MQPPHRAHLAHEGYLVRYREFVGGHTVPPRVAREAVEWFTGEEDDELGA